MTPPTVDLPRCRRDGLCARVCPTGAIHLGPDGAPRIQAGVPCYECGQCAAVCPQGAIAAAGARAEELERLRPGWRLDPEQVGQLLRGRRSVRSFRPDPLPRPAVEAILAAAQYAPSPYNSQATAWIVLEGAPRVRAVAEATVAWLRASVEGRSPLAALLGMAELVAAWERGTDVVCRGAPQLLVAHAPAADPTAPVAGAIAALTAALAALAHGAGTCLAGTLPLACASPEVAGALGLAEGRTCSAALLLGYPAVEVRRVPARRAASITWR